MSEKSGVALSTTIAIDRAALSTRSMLDLLGNECGGQQAGASLGNYTLIEVLGHGGFGAVWLAEQTEPVRREVALKLLDSGLTRPEILTRFEQERQAIAMMNHPNIARVFDAGTTAAGRPFFVMEVVRGSPITTYCDDHRLSIEKRLELFIPVCLAVQHAHQKGIIHRDLKSSNVLVAEHDGKPVPKVIDFGIAKVAWDGFQSDPQITREGTVIGTPQYMSPEQVSARGDIDTRSDIYSLGVLLYELLTGRTPVGAEEARQASWAELERLIYGRDAPLPSARVREMDADALSKRSASASGLVKKIRGDLDWIVLKALEKDRERRYPTANGLALDVRRSLDDEPVAAGPPSLRYRLGKCVRKHRGPLAAAALVFLALAGGLAASLWQAKVARSERDKAFFHEGLGWMLRAQVAEERGKRYPDTLLYAAKAIGYAGHGLDENGASGVIPYIRKMDNPEAFQRAEEWIASRPAYRPVWSGDLGCGVTSLAVSPHGRYLLAGGTEGSKCWDFAGQGAVLDLPPASSVAIHPGGERFALAEASSVSIWEGGREIARIGETVTALAYNLAGDHLAGARPDGAIVLIGEKATELGQAGGRVARLAFGTKDAVLAAAVRGVGTRLFFHHYAEPHLSWSKHADDITSLAWHPDPKSGQLALGAANGRFGIWKRGDAKKIAEIPRGRRVKHGGSVTGLCFSPDGRRLVSGGEDGLVRLWDAADPEPNLLASLCGHTAPVRDVAFLPCGNLVVSGGDDGTVKLWDTSEESKSNDLYSLVKENWYDFDFATQEVTWRQGSGFLNLPAQCLVGAWRGGNEKAWGKHWAEQGNWISAGLVEPDRFALASKLQEEIAEARQSGEYSLASLRSRQMALLGLEPPALENPVKEGENFINGAGEAMIWCPRGTFVRGSPESENLIGRWDSETPHKVTLTSGFWIAKFEVTQELYLAIMGANPSTYISFGPRAPAENVSWEGAVEFCQKLTDLERSRGSIPAGWEYALPTSAQWEYACRAGTTTAFSFGDDPGELYRHGNYSDRRGEFAGGDQSQDDGYQFTAPVGSYPANPWGIHDMHGNVSEWCRDASGKKYPPIPVTDPFVAEGEQRVFRGGCFYTPPARCRSASYSGDYPRLRSNQVGFRPALVRKVAVPTRPR